jgi:dienelactone hydrolase
MCCANADKEQVVSRTLIGGCLLAMVLADSAAATAQSPGAEPIVVRAGGLVADVYVPDAAGRHPAVLLLGGSGGGLGWQRYMGALLAERGFVAMGLAWFGMEGLAPELERIPLEYVEHALTWLRLQPYVDSTRVGVGGVSKGGELALLLGSLRPEVRAVATFVPSGYVFQSIAPGYPRTSSWSYRGRDVPYVAYGSVSSPANLAALYRAGVEQADSLEAATITVERINGPLLLLSGREDTLWPSTWLSDRVVERLAAKGFVHPYEHVAYESAGHLISSIRDDDVTFRGGTQEGNRRAQVDGQRRFLEFFTRHLASGSLPR